MKKYFSWFFFISLIVFFCFTVNLQKLDFYNLQNVLVENLVDFHEFGMKGEKVGDEYFTNTRTTAPKLQFIGDVYYYLGKFYPQKTYQTHYWVVPIYAILKMLNINFTNNYYLTSSVLLLFSSYLLAALGITLTYSVTKKITGNPYSALFVALAIGFGSLLTGGINIRNEETFGYWMLIIGFLLTFMPKPNLKLLFLETGLIFYALAALPAITFLMPFIIVRLYLTHGKNFKPAFGLMIILFTGLIILNNYIIYNRWTYSTYIIGIEAVPAYKRAFFEYNPVNFQEKIYYYFINPQTSVFINYPLIAIALLSVIIAKVSKWEKLAFFAAWFIFAFNITNLRDDAWVGYGSGRYALGLFPLAYLYLGYIFTRRRVVLWLLTLLAAIVSIYRGLFFYFAPVGNVYKPDPVTFINWPLQQNLLWLVAIVIVGILGGLILFNRKTSISHTA